MKTNFNLLNSRFKDRLRVIQLLHDFEKLGLSLDQKENEEDVFVEKKKMEKMELAKIMRAVYFPVIDCHEYEKDDDLLDVKVIDQQKQLH
jgi:hypothetical protein